jgi:hypothetical protein
MRVRVRFRYNADTGEVESFVVEDVGGTRHGRDHDAVHDRVTEDVARVVEQNALIEEVAGADTVRDATVPLVRPAAQPEHARPERLTDSEGPR